LLFSPGMRYCLGMRTVGGFPDPASLRFLLDELRSALPPTGVTALHTSPIGVEQPALLSSLQGILLALEQEPAPRVSAARGVAALFAGDRVALIRDCLESLPAVWLDRVRVTLGPEKIAALRTFLDAPVPDFLDILELSMDENTNSNVLRWLLDPRTAPTIGPATLNALVARLDEGSVWQRRIHEAIDRDSICVRREYTIAWEWTHETRLDRIDLVVSGPDFVLAIENKVLSREHGEQTSRYWEWLEQLRIAHAGIFLSPAGLPATSESFKPVSYLEMLGCLLEGPIRASLGPEEQFVLASYVKTLAAGVLRTELRSIRQREERVQ